MINKYDLLKLGTLTLSDIKGRYRNTFAGVIWVMFSPILMFSVHSIVFKHILKVDVNRYFVFLLSGLLPWIFITGTILQNANVFLTKRELILSFQINPLLIHFSKVLDNFINFIIPFFFLLGVLAFFEDFDIFGILWLPINMCILILMAISISTLISLMQVFFRDTEYIIQFAFNILFFLTPIFYPEKLIPQKYQFLVKFNPIYAVIEPFQKSLWLYDPKELYVSLGQALIYTFTMFVLAYAAWSWKRNEIYLYI